jgi:DNA-binding response OmpR family regulator
MATMADMIIFAPAIDKLPPRVLIVDDNLESRELLARRLQRETFEVVQVASGREALDLIDPRRFDLALVDVMMPDMNGLDVLRSVRARYSITTFPVVMVTGRRESEDIVEALALGANDYVTKPIDFAVVLARVKTQIGRKKAEEELHAANERLHDANEELRRNVEQIKQARDEAEAASAAKTSMAFWVWPKSCWATTSTPSRETVSVSSADLATPC